MFLERSAKTLETFAIIKWKTVSAFIGLFLITCGIDYTNLGDIFRQGKYRYLLLFLSPILFFQLKKHFTWPIAYLASLSLFYYTATNYPVHGAIYMLLFFSILAVAYYFTQFDREVIGKWLVYFGVFQAVIGIFQRLGIHIIFTPFEAWAKVSATGLLGHPTVLGPFVVACLAPALWQKRYISACILIVCAVFSGSSMTYASLCTVLWIWYWYKSGNKLAIYAAYFGAIFLGIAYFISPGANVFALSGRELIWNHAIDAWQSAWLVGHGVGYWSAIYSPKVVGAVNGVMTWPQIHSDYLECLVAFGLVGFVPLMYAIGRFIKLFKPTWTHAVCSALLVNAMANFTFQIASLTLIFIMCWIWSFKQGEE